MLTRLHHSVLAAAALAGLGFAGGAIAQPVDPSAPDAVVEYGGPDPLIIETEAGSHSFTVELANTDASRTRGMMHRESMDDDAGMLFDFEETDFQSIWMRNTLISLDIVFVREDGRIAKIVTNAQPLSLRPMSSDIPVSAVLELRGGRTLELGIDPGDVIFHPLFGNVTAQEAAEAVIDEPQKR